MWDLQNEYSHATLFLNDRFIFYLHNYNHEMDSQYPKQVFILLKCKPARIHEIRTLPVYHLEQMLQKSY